MSIIVWTQGEVFSLILKQFKFNKSNKALISNASASLSRITEFWDLCEKDTPAKAPPPPPQKKASSIQVGNRELWLNLA